MCISLRSLVIYSVYISCGISDMIMHVYAYPFPHSTFIINIAWRLALVGLSMLEVTGLHAFKWWTHLSARSIVFAGGWCASGTCLFPFRQIWGCHAWLLLDMGAVGAQAWSPLITHESCLVASWLVQRYLRSSCLVASVMCESCVQTLKPYRDQTSLHKWQLTYGFWI